MNDKYIPMSFNLVDISYINALCMYLYEWDVDDKYIFNRKTESKCWKGMNMKDMSLVRIKSIKMIKYNIKEDSLYSIYVLHKWVKSDWN